MPAPLLFGRVSKLCADIAKVVQHSDGSVHVSNCPYWPPSASARLRYDCPNALISIQSSCTSLSGFVVVVREHNTRKHINAGLYMACVLAFAVFGLIWFATKPAALAFFIDKSPGFFKSFGLISTAEQSSSCSNSHD